MDEEPETQKLSVSLKRFSVVSAIYFFGIVLSTSAIQMYIFGFLLTFILTVLFSPWFWTQFLAKYYPYILVYVTLLIVNQLVIKKLGARMLSQDQKSIRRPAVWLAYYVICSFMYLLLGLLFAVYRLIYLFLTTLIAINRLDITLFSILPQLDNGHNSFMGMVLMSQAMANIQQNLKKDKSRQSEEAAKRWAKLREAVRSEQGGFLQKLERTFSFAMPTAIDDEILEEGCLIQQLLTIFSPIAKKVSDELNVSQMAYATKYPSMARILNRKPTSL
eukprot:TRINITY_DN14048_c0_g1_i1.p1 TRINITY_DN14048_c0_g1~~TRINITY_DN14048_c0_g1_i1.p1  ORF type:complete len:275 (+),score=26.69 TRINITY_DN14048_c0_g1_i1:1-825(+)